MNRRMDEDVAWLRVQDAQREVENRRLVSGSPWFAAVSGLGRLIFRSLANVRAESSVAHSVARPMVEPRHHA